MNTIHDVEACKKAQLAVRDTLDVVGGKWKLVLLTVLQHGKRRFKELSREVGISPRILSKELQELEMNGLISRTVRNTKPITVEYALTPYSETLSDVLEALHRWGQQHREKIIREATGSPHPSGQDHRLQPQASTPEH
ncbi:DNA-binding transcriptional regulator, HxlR family [Parapedobacter composti]|uniref:DNA-binding transcriptional regulator, HxlR family n=1 Tax=Parapedobacter composti TaxID=623281 RepID=A0A1I1HWA8_9SPHI|nr:helix-turn-helix domain-containing protein [Parapedobacter composti]SFC26258.1 DNA-binding transcriptional regulator, HxlR family [Parapedobacter composti]